MSISVLRIRQFLAWAVTGLFILGFFVDPVGMWTGPILGVWFIGTQKPRRGFIWMFAIGLALSLPHLVRGSFAAGTAGAPGFLGLEIAAIVISLLPLTFHRLVSPRLIGATLGGFASTLPFPLAVIAIHFLAASVHLGLAADLSLNTFLRCWFAATLVWMWNHEFRIATVAPGVGIFAAALVIARTTPFLREFTVAAPQTGQVFAWTCLAGALALALAAALRPGPNQSWANRAELHSLRSPYTADPLQVQIAGHRETLVSPAGEQFPIHNGIPNFLKPEDLAGDNLKYNHLYETIAGFYDDTQRVGCALTGMDRDAYVLSYLGFLEVSPGDRVLETSVGTGLNFKYLPAGIQRFGLDLSPEMLANCQTNLRRWTMDADLFIGNAENLPFADSSFDVVFHVGGINFFSDRAHAIREMIRVAKPGSLLLIADETEKHVKAAYENIPYTREFYKDRKEQVAAPIDLLPSEMEQVSLHSVFNGRFYALTFRKPALVLAGV